MPQPRRQDESPSAAAELVESIESLAPGERDQVLSDPEVRAAYNQARSILLSQGPAGPGKGPGAQPGGNVPLISSIISGFTGGLLAGGPIGATIGAGLGAALPREQGPLDDPFGYLSDIVLPRAASGASRALSSMGLRPSESLPLKALSVPAITGLREGLSVSGPASLFELGRGLYGPKEDKGPFRSAIEELTGPGMGLGLAIGAASGLVRSFRPTPAIAANEVRESLGQRTIPDLLRSPSLAEQVISSGGEHPVAQAFEELTRAARARDQAIREKLSDIDRLNKSIAEARARLVQAKGEAREKVLSEMSNWRAERLRASESLARLQVESIIERFNLQDLVRKSRMGLSPHPGIEPSNYVSLEDVVSKLGRGEISREVAGDLLAAMKSGRVSVSVPGVGIVRLSGPSLANIQEVVDPADLEALRREVIDSYQAGKLTQAESRRLLTEIAAQERRLIDDASRAQTLDEFAQALQGIEASRSALAERRIEEVEARLRAKRAQAPLGGAQDDPEVRRLTNELASLRSGLASERAALNSLKRHEPDLLRESPEVFSIVTKSAGPADFVNALLDHKTPDEAIGKTLAFLGKRDKALADSFRARLSDEYFRRYFQSMSTGQAITGGVQEGKLFQIYADMVPPGKRPEVFNNLREFVSLANEYAYGGGILPYITYGARWTVRSLPSIWLIAGSAAMFPKLATLGVFAIALNTPTILEHIARNSKPGSQFIKWLREDYADPRRLAMYPGLRRMILEEGTPITESNASDFLGTRFRPGTTFFTPVGQAGPAGPVPPSQGPGPTGTMAQAPAQVGPTGQGPSITLP